MKDNVFAINPTVTVDNNEAKNNLEDDNMTTETFEMEKDIVNEPANNTVELDPNAVHLALKKGKGADALAKLIERNNPHVKIGENEEYIVVSAPYMRITRSEAEMAMGGRISDFEWRMLFVKREGGKADKFNNYEFILGTPVPEDDDRVESKDVVQVNTRLDRPTKDEMDRFREMLGMSQSDFIAQAVVVFLKQLRETI